MNNYRDIVLQYKKELCREKVNFVDLVVFGSQVKKKTHLDSDIDVCVLVHKIGDVWATRKKFRKIARRVNIDIEVHPMSISDYNDKYNFLASEIKKYGVKI